MTDGALVNLASVRHRLARPLQGDSNELLFSGCTASLKCVDEKQTQHCP